MNRPNTSAKKLVRLFTLLAVTAAGVFASARASAEPTPGACERARTSSPRTAVGVDFAPFLGTSSNEEGRRATRAASFGLVGALGGGVEGLALSAAATYAPKQIRVNVVAPGLVRAAMTARIAHVDQHLAALTAGLATLPAP